MDFIGFRKSIAPADQPAAQVKGREGSEGFVETLGKRLQSGRSFISEIPDDVMPPGQGEA